MSKAPKITAPKPTAPAPAPTPTKKPKEFKVDAETAEVFLPDGTIATLGTVYERMAVQAKAAAPASRMKAVYLLLKAFTKKQNSMMKSNEVWDVRKEVMEQLKRGSLPSIDGLRDDGLLGKAHPPGKGIWYYLTKKGGEFIQQYESAVPTEEATTEVKEEAAGEELVAE